MKQGIIKTFTAAAATAAAVTVSMLTAGLAIPAYAEGTAYTDMPDDVWARAAIEYCTENGLMIGTGEDKFSPYEITDTAMTETVLERIAYGSASEHEETDAIERDETAKAIIDTIGMKPKGESVIAYSDAAEISEDCLWSVNQCEVLGFMKGRDDGTFDPNGNLTRVELAAVAQRVDEYLKSDFDEVNIIHTNDTHGYDAASSSNIGMDEVAALKKSTENAILADSGDAIQGKDYASLTQGKDVIETMNLVGYDVMSAGNHEFDYGQDVVKSLFETADFPILSANTLKDGEPFFKGTYANGQKENNGANYIIEENGIKVGFFGILTSATKTSTKPTGTVGITFGDETDAAEEQIAELKAQGADVIIGLFHVGVNGGSAATSEEIAEALDGNSDIDAIIDGHSHSVYSARHNGILVAQTGSYLANIGIVNVRIDGDGNVLTSEKLMSAEEIKASVTADETAKAYIEEKQAENSELLNTAVADTATTLWGGYVNSIAVTRITETNLGNLICDAMIDEVTASVPEEYADLPIVAIENGGGVRSTINRGTITKGDIFDVLPFANTVYVKIITPKTLYEVLEKSTSSMSGQDSETGMMISSVSGGFLQIGGMTMSYNPAGEQKVLSVTLNGSDTPLDRTDDSTKMLVAMNDYLAAAGGGYTMLDSAETIMQGTDLEQITEDYILKLTDNGTKALEYPISEGRITPVSDYDGRDYTASVYLKDVNGELLKNTDAVLTLDGTESVSVTSDDSGIVKLTLKNGPHTVSAGSTDTYVDNICGEGIYTSDGDYKVDYPTVTVE